jgi:hypothetical protein
MIKNEWLNQNIWNKSTIYLIFLTIVTIKNIDNNKTQYKKLHHSLKEFFHNGIKYS